MKHFIKGHVTQRKSISIGFITGIIAGLLLALLSLSGPLLEPPPIIMIIALPLWIAVGLMTFLGFLLSANLLRLLSPNLDWIKYSILMLIVVQPVVQGIIYAGIGYLYILGRRIAKAKTDITVFRFVTKIIFICTVISGICLIVGGLCLKGIPFINWS